MNKREFLELGARLSVAGGVGALGLGAGTALAQEAEKGFVAVDPAVETRDPDTVEVLEFFWFGCPHCFRFDPALHAWLENKPDGVSFVREAPPLNRAWAPHSQAYYAAEKLGVLDEFFLPFFDALHVDNRRIRTVPAVADFVGEIGLDKEAFTAEMNTKETVDAINRSIRLAVNAKITGVPTLMINGRFLTSPSIAGTYERTFEVVDS